MPDRPVSATQPLDAIAPCELLMVRLLGTARAKCSSRLLLAYVCQSLSGRTLSSVAVLCCSGNAWKRQWTNSDLTKQFAAALCVMFQGVCACTTVVLQVYKFRDSLLLLCDSSVPATWLSVTVKRRLVTITHTRYQRPFSSIPK